MGYHASPICTYEVAFSDGPTVLGLFRFQSRIHNGSGIHPPPDVSTS